MDFRAFPRLSQSTSSPDHENYRQCALVIAGSSFLSMTPIIPCYLRTYRKEWLLSQEELASLVPGCNRNRISYVERGKLLPRAAELLAYMLIFDCPPQDVFPELAAEVEDGVMRAAAELDRKLAGDNSPSAARKIELLEGLSARAAD
jgi:DNA-binding XRE family transcriptional regulator